MEPDAVNLLKRSKALYLPLSDICPASRSLQLLEMESEMSSGAAIPYLSGNLERLSNLTARTYLDSSQYWIQPSPSEPCDALFACPVDDPICKLLVPR